MKTTIRDLIKTGWNWRETFGGEWEAVEDLLKIRALNIRATNEWTRQNNAGRTTPGAEAASDRKQQRAWDKAKETARAHGWKLEAPGLWWTVRDGKGNDITPHI